MNFCKQCVTANITAIYCYECLTRLAGYKYICSHLYVHIKFVETFAEYLSLNFSGSNFTPDATPVSLTCVKFLGKR